MTQKIEQLIKLNRHGHSYVSLNRDNYSTFFPDHESGPADVAHRILDETLNKASLLPGYSNGEPVDKTDGDPTSCFEIRDFNVKSLVKSIAAQAISEYWLGEVGYIDVNDAVTSDERAENTIRRIQTLGRSSVSKSGAVNLVTVEAGNSLTETESEAASEIYGTLSRLSPQNFRVAILGTSNVFNQVDPV